MVDIDSIKYELNEYVGEFLERSGNGRGYVCPFCGNGSGRDGTGLEFKSEARLWACYGGCGGKKYNAVQLLMESEHLDGFGDASRRACEILGITPQDSRNTPANQRKSPQEAATHKTAPSTPQASKTPQNAKEHLKAVTAWEKHQAEGLAYMGMRGISPETCKRFHIGFTDRYGKENRPGVSIPCGEFGDGYVIRFTDGRNDPKMASNRGKRYAWNPGAVAEAAAGSGDSPAVLFIVEGEINGMTLEQLGAHAVAAGGVSPGNDAARENVERVAALFRPYAGEYPAPVVLCLDDDEPGRNSRAAFHAVLEPLGVFLVDAEPLPGNAQPFTVPPGSPMPPDCFQGDDGNVYRYGAKDEIKDLNDLVRESAENLTDWVLSQTTRATAARERKRAEQIERYKVFDTLDELENGTVARNIKATKTGFMRLDAILNNGRGFASALVVIGGESGSGKTTFAMQLAENIAATGENDILVFSLEMSRADLVARSLSKNTAIISARRQGMTVGAYGWDSGAIDTTGVKWAQDYFKRDEHSGGFNQEQKECLARAYEQYRTAVAPQVFVYEPPLGERVTVSTIEREIRKLQAVRGRAPVVVIDYVQLMRTDTPDQTDKQVMDETLTQLAVLKKTYNTSIFAISALNRMSYGKESTLGGFRESSTIEYSCDVAFIFEYLGQSSRKFDRDTAASETPRKMVLRVHKNRQGPIGVKLHYDYWSAFNLFVEVAPREFRGMADDGDDEPYTDI
jgi:replicative DNA helicase